MYVNLYWSPGTEVIKGNSLVQSGLNLVLYFSAPVNLLNLAFLALEDSSTSKQEPSLDSESAAWIIHFKDLKFYT